MPTKKTSELDLGDGGEFSLEAAIAEAEDKNPPYEFRGLHGEPLQLPNASMLPVAKLMPIIKNPEGHDLDAVADTHPTLRDLADVLPPAIFGKLIANWFKHSKVDVGKSEASPKSSTSTARQSKRTLRSAK